MNTTITTVERGQIVDSVRVLDMKTARPFIEKWHYSKKAPTGKNVFFGWFCGDDLYSVADYGIGVNQAQEKFLRERTTLPVAKGNLFELKRLCRIEPMNTCYPLTKFLSACHRLLKKSYGIRFIVSFSDPAFGHNGGIYKAANFTHLGKTNAEWHVVDELGVPHHRRVALRFMNRFNATLPVGSESMTLASAREQLGLRRVKTLPKDRWFLDLGEYLG